MIPEKTVCFSVEWYVLLCRCQVIRNTVLYYEKYLAFNFLECSPVVISFPLRIGVAVAHLGYIVSEILQKDQVPTMDQAP